MLCGFLSVVIDKSVVARVRAALENETRINLHCYPIAVVAQADDLILSGEVESIAAKKLALIKAADVHGVARIVDRLTVAPAGRMGDAEIRDHVCKLLFEEPALERCLIEPVVRDSLPAIQTPPGAMGSIFVAVADSVVTLNGQVPSLTHKRLAGVLAWWVPGTRDVVNGLEEVPAEEDTDDELTDAVRLALEKDPFVNATEILVTTKNWTVTLTGLVPNETMKRMAERDAWAWGQGRGQRHRSGTMRTKEG